VDAPEKWTSHYGHTCVTYETGVGTPFLEPLCSAKTEKVTTAFQDVMVETAAHQIAELLGQKNHCSLIITG
jgi:hypothetical protein